MERLPGRGSCCVELERIQVWVESDVMSCARYFGPICDAVSQGFPVIGYAYEGSLGACEAEALILEFAALLVDACECSVRRYPGDIGPPPEEYLVDCLRAVHA